MIRVHFDSNTGAILSAFGNNFDQCPTPFVDVDDAVWSAAQSKPFKVVNGYFIVDELTAKRNDKQKENEVKKNAVNQMQVFINNQKVFLKLDTPTMPLPSIMLAFKEFQEKNTNLPAGSFRYYDNTGNVFVSPELSPFDIDKLYWEMFYKYKAIDTYFNKNKTQIENAASMDAVNAIAIDYDANDRSLTDAATAFAALMAAKVPASVGNAALANMSNVLPTDLDRAIRLTNAYHELATATGSSHTDIAQRAKYIETQTALDLTTQTSDVLHLAFQFTADGQTITQTLPPATSNKYLIIENIFAGHTNCSLVLVPATGDAFDGNPAPKTFSSDNIVGVAIPTNNAGYSWVPFPTFGDSTLVVSDGTNIAVGVKKLRFQGAVIQSQNGETLVDIPNGGGSGTGSSGISFTDADAQTVTNVDNVVLQNAKISTYKDEPNKIDISTSVLLMKETGERFAATSLLVQPPIQAEKNGAVIGQAVLGIDQDAFQPKQDDSYLAYLGDNIELQPEKKNPITNLFNADVIWFDSVQKRNQDAIILDRDTKSFGLQESDALDPNISGGTKFLVSVYLDFVGKAEQDCFITLYLRTADNGDYVLDANGNPVIVSKDIKKGTDFGTVCFARILIGKGLQKMQVCVLHNHNKNIVAKGTAYGVSAFLVQELTNGTTSPAKTQFEIDTKTSIRVTEMDMNMLFNSAYEFSQTSQQHTFAAKWTEKTPDGYYVYTKSPLNAWTENKSLRVTQDASKTPISFEMGVVLDPLVTVELQGRDIVTHHIVTLDKANLGVGLFVWNGDGVPTYPVIASIGKDGMPVTNKGWVNTMTSDIIGDPAKQSDLITFAMPGNAKIAAFLIYPKEEYTAFDMTLQEFTVSVATPFVDYVVSAFDESGEHHYVMADEYAKFRDDQFGYGLRYTINQGDTKLPVGTKRSGNAQVELVKAWTDSGYAGEGALKFDEAGTAQIKTRLRLYVGENVPANDFTEATFWYAFANADNTFTKIPASEITFTLKKNDNYPKFYQMSFKVAVPKDSILWLFGKTSKFDDGAYIATGPKETDPLVETDIIFKTPAII